MNIVKIGEQYVNLDNAISIVLHDQEALIVTEMRNYRISAYPSDIRELRDLLEKISDKAKEDWED